MSGLLALENLSLASNEIADLLPVMYFRKLETLQVGDNPLSGPSCTVYLPALRARNVAVLGDSACR